MNNINPLFISNVTAAENISQRSIKMLQRKDTKRISCSYKNVDNYKMDYKIYMFVRVQKNNVQGTLQNNVHTFVRIHIKYIRIMNMPSCCDVW